MLGSAEYARNMRATQSGVNDQSARRRRQHQVTPEEAEARWEQAKKDHMIPFHKMALLTMAATAPAFIMVFMYTEPDVGWHHAVKAVHKSTSESAIASRRWRGVSEN